MKKQYIISAIIISLILISIISCEKDISVNLPRPSEKLTIEGVIELDEYPVVFLTKNSAYFDVIDTAYVNDLIVSGDEATVIVSSNGIVDTLSHQVLNRWPYYGYVGTKFRGGLNSSYDLKVIYGDNEYTSTTNILDTIAIDSVWLDKIDGYDSLVLITVRWQDPTTIGDFYTIYTRLGYKCSTNHT